MAEPNWERQAQGERAAEQKPTVADDNDLVIDPATGQVILDDQAVPPTPDEQLAEELDAEREQDA